MRRGQTLFLICAALFLLAVMVCLTLSLSRMTKKKMELQLAADAAAYSQAVAAARTYNAVALMNRAMAAQLVASLGVEGAISYSSEWFAMVHAAWAGLQSCASQLRPDCASWGTDCDGLQQICGRLIANRCSPYPSAGDGTPAGVLAEERMRRYTGAWASLDANAAAQARALNLYARKFGDYNTRAMMLLRNGTVRSTSLASRVGSYPNPNIEVSRAPVPANLRELDLATTEEEVELGSVQVTHASRTHRFITRRMGGESIMLSKLRGLLGGTIASVELLEEAGNSYYDRIRSGGATGGPYTAYGDDRGRVQLRLSGVVGNPVGRWRGVGPPGFRPQRVDGMLCPSVRAESYVESTDQQNRLDRHVLEPRWGTNADGEVPADPGNEPADERHTMGPRMICPGPSCIWPLIWDTNPDVLTDARDLFGQPKLLVSAAAPLGPPGGAADPWNLLIRFRFQPSTAGAELDLKSLQLKGGEDVSRQQAVATGLVYYHRTGHFREPPNLFNPFWRATLIHADVDRSGRADFRRAVNGSGPPHVTEAWDELAAAGFDAVP